MTKAATVHRVEVRTRPGLDDPRARALQKDAEAMGVWLSGVQTAKVYLVEADLAPADLDAIRARLLVDPVVEVGVLGAQPQAPTAQIIEVHPLPGVMDPAAQSVRLAITELIGRPADVSTAARYDLAGATRDQADAIARRLLANPIVHAIHDRPYHPASLPRGKEQPFRLRHVPLRDLSDDQLARLSRDAHLFLSLDEMRAIQAEFRRVNREPTDIELETLAQTWSEHCVHKTLKSRIRYRPQGDEASIQHDPIRWQGRPGHTVHADGSVTIDNLLKSTVAAATHELIAEGIDWTLSVFKDNAGVIAFDERHAVCVKVETHNHPSALEPYGGSATGVGGCIRDVIGTGLGAKPIANTDVFCVATPDGWRDTKPTSTSAPPTAQPTQPLPPGTLHPRRILSQVVAGVRDYGNRMGIPTVAGAVAFDDRYVGNPLVFCGCVGLMPRHLIAGAVNPGDRIIALGGRTGRDGIHGATFSSAELEQGHTDEFSHAVQIGNAIEEKRLLDAILRARDQAAQPLFSAITDCGAGGFSSAVGEMGRDLGAHVTLENAPLKYAGLTYTEIWISEAQERMVLAVPVANLAHLRRICDEEGVELADLGHFGTPTREIILTFQGHEVGRLDCHFLHHGLPQPTREAVWAPADPRTSRSRDDAKGGLPTASTTSSLRNSIPSSLLSLLTHPNIASKHWIIRQYDHEVQGNTVIKPLVGPLARGPGDAAVIEPVPGTGRGLGIACGLQTGVGDPAIGGDPYLMALAAVDECVRNLVCVGVDPARIAILDNFSWPSCQKPENLGTLVRAAEGCYDAAKAYRTPFVSGKDSLNNQLRYTDPDTGQQRVIEIPPTLLITGIGILPALDRACTMDAKQPGNLLLLVGPATGAMGGSLYALRHAQHASHTVPRTDLALGPRIASAVHRCIASGMVRSAHDVSEGGALVAIAEMLIASGGLGASLTLERSHADHHVAAFSEAPSRYVLEVAAEDAPHIAQLLEGVPHCIVGTLDTSGRLVWSAAGVSEGVESLARVWRSPLDW